MRSSSQVRSAIVAICCLWSLSAANAGPIYFSDFEADDGGWTESGFGDWERGTINFTDSGCGNPGTTGPSGAYSGSNAWGTVLNTCHNNPGASSVLSQTFDLTGYASAAFDWYQWIEVFYSFDRARLFANGTLVYERTTTNATAGWEQQTVDLTPYVGGLVSMQFDLFASTVVNRPGWYVDDISVTGTPVDGSVPEPGTLGLLGLGLAGLAASRRRKQ